MSKKKNKNNQPENNNQKNKNNNSLDSQLINNLKNKYKVDELSQEHVDAQKHSIEQANEKNKEILEAKKVDNTIDDGNSDKIGWNKPKILARNFLYGIFMGLSDGVPGYSGGTTLSIIGFYDSLIDNIRRFFSTKTNFFKVNLKYFVWFLPFVIAWIGAFVGLNFAISGASDVNYGIVFVFLFGFFALFSIPLFYIKNKNELLTYKFPTLKKDIKSSWSNKISLILLVFGFLLMIAFSLMARFIPSTGGVSFLRNSDESGKILDPSNFDTNRIILWLIAGYFAGIAMIIPGVSGGIVLYMFNVYPQLNYAISNVFNDANFIPYIAIIIISAILGIITSIFIVNKVTTRWKPQFMNFSLGLVCGSFITIFVSLSANDYATLSDGSILGTSIGMIFVALFINVVIFVILNELKMIDFPKLRFINKNKEQTLN